ncbi:MAG: ABC transporter ATP-binding protein [Roseibium album]|uniref:Maltose/maltodextrin import ATP-binding protein MalK n=2 Tax=cellular organisms TaxID=131567 RepID=A0A0M6ZGX8_9HYPH|nr:ABC transporter ATP-binding protein [Roseibium album]MBG6144537.1 inositol-phosphate transport system ATP-binding protein [Labrenzia sp. EL_142]MBG6154298.1 inositol-phosphate transport system ATP-binding protein [Labrenzia sp. EL_162]MBG6161582.1 inositol-phosphate transport system ATP-binding protein [Labrenzia sp. EL_195]MBG6175167.1 inositol-phosphate transport system ATP-binding protein [Labrenzia sp. EL_132]MBG6193573.1 inositol-phosphate transport system ATP-binding protein [Labrenzi
MRISIENFTKAFGTTTVIKDMSLEINSGEMLALLGPSGCGKSTTLFAICGIHRMNSGRLLFGERDVTRISSQQRNVGVVFQNYALYPHMNVFDNIAFPLKVRRDTRADIERKVKDIADLVHIGELLHRKPAELSGGQQQRVALARALVREPDILLLDEPLANLDAKLRLEMRSEIRRIQQQTGITAVLVTHDQVEAMSMCDRIAIMDQGKIMQLSSPKEMYEDPSSDFVAGFLGNPPIAFLEGVAAEGGMRLANSEVTLPVPAAINLPDHGAAVRFGIRPEFFQPDNDLKIKGRISFVETQGREELYDVTLENGSVLRSIQSQGGSFKLGDNVNWGIAGDRILAFDAAGNRL